MTKEELYQLTTRFLQGTASDEEKYLLQQWYAQNLSDDTDITIPLQNKEEQEATVETALYRKIQQAIQKQPLVEAPVHRLPWKRWAAAAVIAFTVLGGGYWWLSGKNAGQPVEVQQVATTGRDLAAPVTNRAILILANGEKIMLDTAGKGVLATQDNMTVTKTADGQLAYLHNETAKPFLHAINTLAVPAGSPVVSLTLSDGSKVWLNAASSIKYPAAFTGTERKVTITGEVYFEVAPHRLPSGLKAPFLVTTKDMTVEVLGTHFNINSYDDEPVPKTTLLEGSVRVVNRQSSIGNPPRSQTAAVILQPGQQAQLVISSQSQKSPPIQVQTVDIESVIAWKNGFFNLKDANIKEIMRQVSRWYNVEVEYKGDVSGVDFYGVVSRRQQLSHILSIMEKTGLVHFRVEGNKIIVSKQAQ